MVVCIAAERSTVRVDRQRPTSTMLAVTGWDSGSVPTIALSAPGGHGLAWVSVHASTTAGATLAVVVVFDPARGRKPRPGTYVVDVHATSGSEVAATRLEFVVERHPCLQVSPRPTFTWDPLSNTATVGVSLWSCGNVDLDVTWTARVRRRRLIVEPATVHVGADGGAVPVTLSISIPKGKVDVDTEIVLHARSAAPTVSTVATTGLAPAARPRHGTHALAAAMVIVAAVLVGVVAAVSRDGGAASSPPAALDTTSAPVPTVPEPPDTTVGASTSVPDTSAETTTIPTTSAVPLPPKIVVEGAVRQALRVAIGRRGTVTFVVANRGGSDARVRVKADGERPSPSFSVVPGGCDGVLGAGQTCEAVVAFAPTKPGPLTAGFVVVDDVAGASIPLTVDGAVDIVDLAVAFADPAWGSRGCPAKAPECFYVTVRNHGTVGSPATTVRVTSGTRSIDVPVRPLGPDESLALVASLARACDIGCSATATVDPTHAIPELTETDNTDQWFTNG